jgi:hypothetical protein
VLGTTQERWQNYLELIYTSEKLRISHFCGSLKLFFFDLSIALMSAVPRAGISAQHC